MALTTSFDGTNITDCGTSTIGNWDNDTISSAGVSTTGPIEGTENISSLANNKDGWIHYDYSGTGSFDFSDDGADWGKHIFFWIKFTTPGIINNAGTAGTDAQGLYLVIGSDDTNFACYTIAGGDYPERYSGGWRRFVIDPRKNPTSWIGTAASVNFASISRFGVGVETTGSSGVADNLHIDRIDVGYGLIATGTGTTDDSWQDILDDDNVSTNKWGCMQESNGIFFAYSGIEIGDDGGTTDTTFTDQNKVIQFVTSEYFDTNDNWVSSVGDDFLKLNIVDHASYTTSFTDGVLVGSDNGRNGCTYIGGSGAKTEVDMTLANAGSDINLYGTTMRNMDAGITLTHDSDYAILGCNFVSCGIFDPVGAPVIRNCNFINTSDFDTTVAACIQDDGGAYTDYTAEANDVDADGTGDINFTPATPTTSDYVYIASEAQFNKAVLMITSGGTGAITWQYYNGSWVSLSGVVDGTNSLANEGVNPITWTMPADWTTTTVNSQGPFYYIRGDITTAGTQAVGEAVWCYGPPDGSALLWNSNISIQACNFIANTDDDNDPHGIEHQAAASPTYTALVFAGNDHDVENSSASGTVSISVSGTGAASSAENTNGGTTNFLSSVDLEIHVEDTGGVDLANAQVYIQKSATGKQWNYTSHATNNAVGDTTFEVVEVVDTDLPQEGWLHVWDASSNTKQNYRYVSWTGKIFTLQTEVTYNCTGGGTANLLQDSVNNFTSLEIKEGDTVRNTTTGAWAVVDEITDASNITTTTLSSGVWTSGNTYSFHKLAVLYNANDKVDVPLFNAQTDSNGDASGSYNWGAIGAILPIRVRIRSNQDATKYIPYNTSGQITGSGYSLTAVLTEDDVAT